MAVEILHTNARGQPVGMSNCMARHSDEVVAKARKMRADGMTYTAIGKALGVPMPTIQSWCGESGHKRRHVAPVRITVRRVKERKAPCPT